MLCFFKGSLNYFTVRITYWKNQFQCIVILKIIMVTSFKNLKILDIQIHIIYTSCFPYIRNFCSRNIEKEKYCLGRQLKKVVKASCSAEVMLKAPPHHKYLGLFLFEHNSQDRVFICRIKQLLRLSFCAARKFSK